MQRDKRSMKMAAYSMTAIYRSEKLLSFKGMIRLKIRQGKNCHNLFKNSRVNLTNL